MIERDPVIEDPTGDMDDFQQIKGIGPSIAQALHAGGVHRFAALANYTPEELVNLLSIKVAFITIQRIERDDWLGQARRLASVQVTGDNLVVQAQEPSSPAPGSPDALSASNHLKHRSTSWREIADFFVSFGHEIDQQGELRLITRVHHSQADQFIQWEGVASEQLITWMLAQAKLSAIGPADVPLELQDEAKLGPNLLVQPEEEAQVELSDLWISQVEAPSSIDGESQSGVLRLESKITLTGPDAINLTYERIPYNIQVYLVNTETNQSSCTAIYTGQLSPEELSYQVHQDFPTPKRGRYQVNVIGQLNLPGKAGALRTLFSYLQGPLLRVEA
jgi:hypothetical protein